MRRMKELSAPFLCPVCRAPFWSAFALCRNRQVRPGAGEGPPEEEHEPMRVRSSAAVLRKWGPRVGGYHRAPDLPHRPPSG